jgi:hypothetical protein
MKRFFTLFFTLGAIATISISNSNGVFTADYTGSANLSTQHCASAGCHNSSGFSGDGTIDIKVLSGTTPVMSYTPGAMYTISITRPVTVSKVGMQSGAMLWASSTPTGSISNTINPTHMQLNTVTGGTMISHTTLGSTAAINAGVATWKYTWTAPPTDVGAIDIYAVMNLSNNDSTALGDSVVRNIFTLQKPNSINEQYANPLGIRLFPNPSSDYIRFQTDKTISGSSNIKLFTLSGRLVKQKTVVTDLNLFQLDIQDLPASTYFCLVEMNNKKSISLFVKK